MYDHYIVFDEEIVKNATPWQFNFGGNDGGIYFLLKDEYIVYVGQATCFASRLNSHKKSKKVWNRCYLLPIEDLDDRTAVEAIYINALDPLYNTKEEPLPEGYTRYPRRLRIYDPKLRIVTGFDPKTYDEI